MGICSGKMSTCFCWPRPKVFRAGRNASSLVGEGLNCGCLVSSLWLVTPAGHGRSRQIDVHGGGRKIKGMVA